MSKKSFLLLKKELFLFDNYWSEIYIIMDVHYVNLLILLRKSGSKPAVLT